MTNNTMIPVQWRVEGVENLGDEFVCNSTSGVIDPQGSFTLILHFRALKPLLITPKEKKTLKVLVRMIKLVLIQVLFHLDKMFRLTKKSMNGKRSIIAF